MAQKERGSRRPSPAAPRSKVPAPDITHFPAAEFVPNRKPVVGDLRRALTGSTWTPHARLRDDQPLPRFPLGGTSVGLSPADASRRMDWSKAFEVPPRNPYLLQRCVELGYVRKDVAAAALPFSGLPAASAPPASSRPGRELPRPSRGPKATGKRDRP